MKKNMALIGASFLKAFHGIYLREVNINILYAFMFPSCFEHEVCPSVYRIERSQRLNSIGVPWLGIRQLP